MRITNILKVYSSCSHKLRSRISFLLRFILCLGIISFFVLKSDFSKIVEVFANINFNWIFLALCVQIVAKFIWAYRWSKVLEIYKLSIPYWRLVKAIYVGLFLGTFIPTMIGGDFFRGYWILDDKKLYSKSMFIIFIERVFGIIIISLIALPAFCILFIQNFDLEIRLLPFLVIPIASLCCGLLILHPSVFKIINRLFSLSSSTFMVNQRNKIIEALSILHSLGVKKWIIIVFTFLVQFSGISFYFCAGQALGIDIIPWHYMVIVPIVVVVTMFPISFYGIGVREGIFVLFASVLGSNVTTSEIISLGLVILVISLIISLIGGIIYIVDNKKGDIANRMNGTPTITKISLT